MNKGRILKFIDSFQWLFGVQNYSRTIVFEKEDYDDITAEITFNEKYQRIKIKLYPCFFKEPLEEQRKALLHEFCHVLTIPMKCLFSDFQDGKACTYETIKNTNERETSQIENILNGLLQGRLKYATTAYKNYIKVKRKCKKK